MSPRMYESAAAKQKAYRDRLREAGLAAVGPRPVKPRQPSRPGRLATIEEALRALGREYGSWLDTLPANLAESRLAEQLAEIAEALDAIADDVAALEPPRFGRASHGR